MTRGERASKTLLVNIRMSNYGCYIRNKAIKFIQRQNILNQEILTMQKCTGKLRGCTHDAQIFSKRISVYTT